MNFRKQIIALLRGRYAVPVISALAELGVIERLLRDRLRPGDLTGLKNQKAFIAVLDYLVSIGMLARTGDGYDATELGRHILLRSGSANIMESYNDYFTSLTAILTGQVAENRKFKTNRAVNILGSGSLHTGKYFLPGFGLMPDKSFATLIDLGCGDGSFLRAAVQELSGVTKVTALDISDEAVGAATTSLRHVFPDSSIKSIVCNAASVDIWAGELGPPCGTELLSAWFVVHEFCRGEIGEAVRFFRSVFSHRPEAHILLGEIVKATPETLARSHSDSIMPEFLLFHALSGQAPLSWADWSEVRKEIPYRVVGECICDPIPDGIRTIPSSFIWYLVPSGIEG